MKDCILDTSVLVDYLRGRKPAIDLIKDLRDKGALLVSCEVTVAEVYSGMREHEKLATDELLDSLDYRITTQKIAKRAGSIRSHYAKKGGTLSLADVLIAALALEEDLAIATWNKSHYPLPELTIID